MHPWWAHMHHILSVCLNVLTRSKFKAEMVNAAIKGHMGQGQRTECQGQLEG